MRHAFLTLVLNKRKHASKIDRVYIGTKLLVYWNLNGQINLENLECVIHNPCCLLSPQYKFDTLSRNKTCRNVDIRTCELIVYVYDILISQK